MKQYLYTPRDAQEYRIFLADYREEKRAHGARREAEWDDMTLGEKRKFNRDSKDLDRSIERTIEILKESPPEPLHPTDAINFITEILQEKVDRHAKWLAEFLPGFIRWQVNYTYRLSDIIKAEWHAKTAIEIVRVLIEFEPIDPLERWNKTLDVFRRIIKRETSTQMSHSGGGSLWNMAVMKAEADARIDALNGGWLSMEGVGYNYDHLDECVQVWVWLQWDDKRIAENRAREL